MQALLLCIYFCLKHTHICDSVTFLLRTAFLPVYLRDSGNCCESLYPICQEEFPKTWENNVILIYKQERTGDARLVCGCTKLPRSWTPSGSCLPCTVRAIKAVAVTLAPLRQERSCSLHFFSWLIYLMLCFHVLQHPDLRLFQSQLPSWHQTSFLHIQINSSHSKGSFLAHLI